MASMISDYKTAFRSFNRNVKLMLAYYLFNAVGQGVMSVLLNLYFLKLGLDENFLGSTVLTQAFVLAALVLPFGMLADRIPKEKIIKVAFFLINAGFTGFVMFKDPRILLACFALQGVGYAMAAGSEFPYLAENTPAEARTHLFSINTVVYTTGPALGMTVGGYLPKLFGGLLARGAAAQGIAAGSSGGEAAIAAAVMAESADAYRLALICSVVLFWIAALVVMPLRRTEHAVPLVMAEDVLETKTVRRRFSLKLSNPKAVLGLSLNEGFVGLAASLFIPFANVIMNHRFAMPAHQIGWVMTAQNLAISLSVLVVPKIAEKRGSLAGATMIQAMAVPAYVGLALASNSGIFTTLYIVRGVLANMPYPMVDAYKMDCVKPGERGTVNAATNLVRNLAWGLGGKVGGMLLKQASYAAPILMASGIYACAVCTFAVMLRDKDLRHPKCMEETGRPGSVINEDV